MTAKMKVDFISAVANGSKIPCPECGSENKPEARFCTICGNVLVKPPITEDKPDDKARVEEVKPAVAEKPLIMPKKNSESPIKQKGETEPQEVIPSVFEEKSAFADGLPEWTLEPPQVLVNRRNRK